MEVPMSAKIPSMPNGRSCRYTVVKFGDLNREETMNIAVLVWEHAIGPDAPVIQTVLEDWTRIAKAFPQSGADGWVREEVIRRLAGIKTFGDYERTYSKMGPYAPFAFREPYPSIAYPEQTLTSMVKWFLVPPDENPVVSV